MPKAVEKLCISPSQREGFAIASGFLMCSGSASLDPFWSFNPRSGDGSQILCQTMMIPSWFAIRLLTRWDTCPKSAKFGPICRYSAAAPPNSLPDDRSTTWKCPSFDAPPASHTQDGSVAVAREIIRLHILSKICILYTWTKHYQCFMNGDRNSMPYTPRKFWRYSKINLGCLTPRSRVRSPVWETSQNKKCAVRH